MPTPTDAPGGGFDNGGTMAGNRSLTVIAVIAAIFLLDKGAPFFIPLFVAILISYALSPLVDAFTRVLRYRVLSAAIVVLGLAGLFAAGAWAWQDDVAAIWEKVPGAVKSISKSVQEIARKPGPNPVAEVTKAAQEIENIATPGAKKPPPAQSASAPAVSITQLLWTGWKGVSIAAAQLMVVVFLVFFILASGDLFKQKIVRIAGEKLARQRFTLQVIDEIDLQIRRYLVVVLVSNVLVGMGVWLAFRVIGVEYAELWGVAAGILHTAPYFGPALVAAASLVAAFMQFHSWTTAFLVAGATIVVATIVGFIFATWLASRQTRMNTTASFVGLLFFSWIWGLWGVLLAIPILAIVKTVCDRNEHWKPVGELLGR
ncbi:MAG TPA: AI-2E family transporter [Usitatibacter sp.]|nr:AI-2E family transporter [Usitatibacter sp.]